MAKPLLRIFISSTAVDLPTYREKVRDAILRLDAMPVQMETFSALPGQPVSECIRMAAEADAVICIVAHRYGYVPPVELGGDGESSITWLEVKAAKRVFAFLVDPKAPWTELKEQDRLVSEPEKTTEIVKAVQKLQEFKAYLERECTRQTFTNPDDLALQVTAALAGFSPHSAHTARVWKPLLCHALQPAQHFRGREAKLQELKEWLESPVTPDRVISVVAAGGTGKTALVDQALRRAARSDRAGLFVWSFYEDPHTDAFLREAYIYFTGETDAPAGGMLERLQIALSGDMPHVLILDGLERVQSEGDRGRRGELEDLQLKRLVKALAGGIGAARALVTSRFPLVDLDDRTGVGHRPMILDDLERPVALQVLRDWGVKGDDAALVRLIEPLNISGSYHALSVAVLGSYLGNFRNGDPSLFSMEDAKADDLKAQRLFRILEQYWNALNTVERDLLSRLSLFPRGVKVEILGWIAQAGRKVAGALIGLADRDLIRNLERLKGLGLVFRYETDGQAIYSAHPFLREFFRNLLGTKPESVHESVRARLAPSLEARPEANPTETAILDQYEMLIEQTLRAGHMEEAFDLYWHGLGHVLNLGFRLGENVRGLRILESFVPSDDFSAIESGLPVLQQCILANDLGVFASLFGDLTRAQRAFDRAGRLAPNGAEESLVSSNLSELEHESGRFPSALEQAERALSLATAAKNPDALLYSFGVRACHHFALGNLASAMTDRVRSDDSEPSSFYYSLLVHQAESKLLLGDRQAALNSMQVTRESGIREGRGHELSLVNAMLARILPPENPAQAALHLEEARDFASRSGAVELQLRCFHAACELQRHLGNHTEAIAEGEAGVLLADTCGFGKWSIDIRIALAETYLVSGDPQKSLQNARAALDLSEHPDCQYAWGKADGLHFCGMAHLRLGERELARHRLTAALEIREKLGHGRREETRRALDSLTDHQPQK